jgi:hypothetical protein
MQYGAKLLNIAVLILLIFTTTISFADAQAPNAKTICLVIDSEPAVLTKEARQEISSGLCSVGKMIKLSVDDEKETKREILLALAMNDMSKLDKHFKQHDAGRILYSIHSSAGDLVIHGVYLYDPESGRTYVGGKTFDKNGAIKNADRKWAKQSAQSALDSIATTNLAQTLAGIGSMAAVQSSQILLQREKPTQFLKPRSVYSAADLQALRDEIEKRRDDIPQSTLHLSICAWSFLSGNTSESIEAFEKYARTSPGTAGDIMRVNLLLATHQFDKALKASEAADSKLGFDLFCLSKAQAWYGLGNRKKALSSFKSFVARQGLGWEDAVIPIISSAYQNGYRLIARNLTDLFLSSSPADARKIQVESLIDLMKGP